MNIKTRECRDLIALNLINGLGPLSIKRLVERAEDTEKIFSMKKEDFREIAGISRTAAEKIASSRESDAYKKEIQYTERENINVLCLMDEGYPKSLKNIYDPPAVLYYKGAMPAEDDVFVAVVGARRCSLYGMRMAEEFSAGMAECGVTIVSGMAQGIDSAAHRGTMRVGGRTVAVMGTGFKHMYPEGSEKLANEICARGTVLTEFPCDTTPTRSTFPRRNRIISGMSRGVLVVEAAKRSGALITVDFALEQGKDVFAVPGPVGSTTSLGTNLMIQNGAKLVLSAKDVLDEVIPDVLLNDKKQQSDLFAEDITTPEKSVSEKVLEGISSDQQNVLEAIPAKNSVNIDEIGLLSGVGAGNIYRALLSLELKGIVKALPGAMYERLVR